MLALQARSCRFKSYHQYLFRDVVQFGRTLDLGSRGRRFEPCHSDCRFKEWLPCSAHNRNTRVQIPYLLYMPDWSNGSDIWFSTRRRRVQLPHRVLYGDSSSVGRMSDCGSEGCEFEPHLSPFKRRLVERMQTRSFQGRNTGSTPVPSITK